MILVIAGRNGYPKLTIQDALVCVCYLPPLWSIWFDRSLFVVNHSICFCFFSISFKNLIRTVELQDVFPQLDCWINSISACITHSMRLVYRVVHPADICMPNSLGINRFLLGNWFWFSWANPSAVSSRHRDNRRRSSYHTCRRCCLVSLLKPESTG